MTNKYNINQKMLIEMEKEIKEMCIKILDVFKKRGSTSNVCFATLFSVLDYLVFLVLKEAPEDKETLTIKKFLDERLLASGIDRNSNEDIKGN